MNIETSNNLIRNRISIHMIVLEEKDLLSIYGQKGDIKSYEILIPLQEMQENTFGPFDFAVHKIVEDILEKENLLNNGS